MIFLVGLVLGLTLGFALGVLFMAMVVAGSHQDELQAAQQADSTPASHHQPES